MAQKKSESVLAVEEKMIPAAEENKNEGLFCRYTMESI
jgi:hypothetical protein